MGGTIGFTLREKSGEEHRMSRWTNWTPWAIDNLKLVKNDPQHISDILHEWIEESALPEDEKHWAYRYPYLAPSEYGLVVVDFVNNKILDCNHYHHFAHMHSIGLKNEYQATHISDSAVTLGGDGESLGLAAFFGDKENDAARFFDFYKEGRIKDVQRWKVDKWVSLGEDVNRWPIEKIVDELINVEESCVFVLDMSPFEVTTFIEGAEGFTNFRQAVLDLGFVLTEKEEEIWSKRINRYEEEE
jgi:hypothetical protein